MPSIIFNGNNITMYGEQNDKDLHLLLHSSLCVGFDELDSFGKRESSNLKAMITRNVDVFRPPYGASTEEFPRRFTLYGCGNRYEFLQTDPSGYRRYAIVEVKKLLDFKSLEQERDQLWAEAWIRYQEGCKFWEVEGASQQAERFTITNPMEQRIEEFLSSWFQTTKQASGGTVYFTIQDLLQFLDMPKIGPNSSTMRDITALLHGMGITKPDKASRHPGTGKVGKWYVWTPPE